jgi:hypothetical protein
LTHSPFWGHNQAKELRVQTILHYKDYTGSVCRAMEVNFVDETI